MSTHDWRYNEFQQGATDYADAEEVQAYDAKMRRTVQSEGEQAAAIGIGAGQTVIELGCGTGCFSLGAAQRCRQVYAVDISNAMLDYARSRAAELGIANVAYVNAGFLTYQHEADPVDWIVSQYALHHLPDAWKAVALTRMLGMLAEGGRLLLRDVVFSFKPVEYDERVEGWIENRPDTFPREEFTGHIRDEYSTFDFVMESLLEEAGFRVERAAYRDGFFAEYLCTKGCAHKDGT